MTKKLSRIRIKKKLNKLKTKIYLRMMKFLQKKFWRMKIGQNKLKKMIRKNRKENLLI